MSTTTDPTTHGATRDGAPFLTHAVTNQVPPLVDHDAFSEDPALVEGLRREGGGWAQEECRRIGRRWGAADMVRRGFDANEHEPVLRTHDRYGHRIDEVEFHPAWHELVRAGREDRLHALPWTSDEPGAHVARAVQVMAASQAEQGFGCPSTMTFAAVPALRAQPELAAEWVPRLTSAGYDPALRPAADKPGAVCGMAMTEKQGGSDVRANTTTARALAADGGAGGAGAEHLLRGHKWFCSAPMSDVFLVLARVEDRPAGADDVAPGVGGGLSCFLLPRVLPDGERNGIHLQRLKEKLGNRSNASSEIELHDAHAWMVGEPGRGVPTIIEMVAHTRLDCVLGSTAIMRRATSEATWHVAHRHAFGRRLADQPLMRAVIADLALEVEASIALALRLARAYDESHAERGHESEQARAFRRVATAIGKYHVCKRAPQLCAEALECLGGNGYVEASGLPRLYREAPVNSVWEGSGNVMALDVLRALSRDRGALDALEAELDLAAGADARYDEHVAALRADLRRDPRTLEARARGLVERAAVALQAGLLLRHAPAAVADAFVASRIARPALQFGALPDGVDVDALVARATPWTA